jgi:hypothetical protein
MSQPTPGPVPNHLWICGHCGGPNLISKDPTHCPVDGHPRDYNLGCCKNPGEASARGLFPEHSQYGYEYADCYAAQHAYNSTPSFGYERLGSLNETMGYSDLWTCNECGTEDNPDYHTECPICGAARPAEGECAMAADFTSYGGAGSTAPGAWQCNECGCPNGPNDTHCASCQTPAP